MTHHRCTRCKGDVGECGIRHKYASGLFCEGCLRELGVLHGRKGFWGRLRDLWNTVVGWVRTYVKPKKKPIVLYNSAVKTAHNVARSKALRIPVDVSIMNPQKR